MLLLVLVWLGVELTAQKLVYLRRKMEAIASPVLVNIVFILTRPDFICRSIHKLSASIKGAYGDGIYFILKSI